MKRTYFTILFFALASLSFTGTAQNLVVNGDLELWDDATTPTGWDLAENIAREESTVHDGDYAAGQMSASSSKKFRQDIEGIVGGQQYTISYYFLDNVDNAKTRIWSYWMDSEGGYLDDDVDVLRPDVYSENDAEWQHYNQVLTAPANAAQFRFEVRVYHQDNLVDGYVYYDDFSLVGEETDYPEPSNYPTNFIASADGFAIDLAWTDATGEQLPGAYLVLGQKGTSGNFTDPVDGTPVADDLDWSDDKVAVNVAYGDEMYSFTGLEGGEAYEFTIYPYTNAGDNINYKTDGEPPYATAEISDIIVINMEDFEDGTLGTWSEYSVEGDQKWEPYEYQGDNFARISGYDGGALDNEDWLISPSMALNVYQDVKFIFISAKNYTGPDLQLYYSEDYDGSSDPNNFTWQEITDQANWSPGDYTWTESGAIELPTSGTSTYLAFKYTSDTDAAAVWQIDDILVYSEGGVGIFENKREEISMYPNPATDQVSFNINQDGNVSIVNLAGQLVYQNQVSKGQIKINVQTLPEGLYLIRFAGDDAIIQTGKLLIE